MAKFSRRKRPVPLVNPEQPEARDEGPRLIPLPEDQRGESRLNHYIALANIALGVPSAERSRKNPPKAK